LPSDGLLFAGWTIQKIVVCAQTALLRRLDKLSHVPAPKGYNGRGLQLQIKKHDRFRTMGDAQWRRGENHRTVTLAG
jgi:hypothetical protein